MVIAIAGDLHGALDLLYARLKAWEERSGRRIDLVLQCGDLEPASYLAGEKQASHPTWFVRGNNEDFDLLASRPDRPIDPAGRIVHLAGGKVYPAPGGWPRIAALGGIEVRNAREPSHPKYIQAADAAALLALPPGSADILLTHDGPIGRSLEGKPWAGSKSVYDIVKNLRPRWHFFGHYDRPLPPFDLHGCRSVCANPPGPARLPGTEGAVARLDPETGGLAWILPDGSEAAAC